MPLSIRWLDHTAIAVRDIEAALPLYRDLMGGDAGKLREHPERDFCTVTLRYPRGGGIELIAPMGERGFVQEFLEKYGEGVHHITFIVEDLAASVAEARAAGLRVVGEDRSRSRWQEAFISPTSAHGTIIQLAQIPPERTQRIPPGLQICAPTIAADGQG
jgi:methylmalonyl-CoA/ethylmalonyl-CoA epimerase